jgi:hypothetical protein
LVSLNSKIHGQNFVTERTDALKYEKRAENHDQDRPYL